MGRKSEVDKILEANRETFKKYDSFKWWAKIHLRVKPYPKKYEDAFNKLHGEQVEENVEESS